MKIAIIRNGAKDGMKDKREMEQNTTKIGFFQPFYSSLCRFSVIGGLMGGIMAGTVMLPLTPIDAHAAAVDWDQNEPQINLSASAPIIAPVMRPDPIVMLPLAPENMILPESRPDRRSLYPQTAITIDAFYQNQFGKTPTNKPQSLKLKSGEGMATLLKRAGFSAQDAQEAIQIVAKHRSMRSLPIGFQIDSIAPTKAKDSTETDSDAGAFRLALEDDYDLTLYQTQDGGWASQISARPIERFLTYSSGIISSSLYKASKEAGMSDQVFNTFVQVLSFSVDFQREIKKGDSFEALFETKRDLISGKTKFGTDLYYISMTLSGDLLEYFRHEHADGTIGWYDRAGNSASRTLMRTPVNGARLSSGYGKRKHPILGYSKMHKGLDFAAPTGTPIMAAGSGIVESSGWNGSYGKYIRIRHNSTYKTAYAHMSKIKRGITPGQRVNQGEIIGYIGSTGRSTGPHLHYEILVNGRKVNPLTVRLPAGKSIPEIERKPFELSMAAIEEELMSRGISRLTNN